MAVSTVIWVRIRRLGPKRIRSDPEYLLIYYVPHSRIMVKSKRDKDISTRDGP